MRAIVADVASAGPACYVPLMAEELRRLTDQEKVIRAFVRDGRLTSIPAKPRKRELLLPYLLDRCFPEDRAYAEREVNQRLALLHPDVSALRRYLVDGGLMTRGAGIYRRSVPMALDGPRPNPWPTVRPARRSKPAEGP
jgi:hypothetical protein